MKQLNPSDNSLFLPDMELVDTYKRHLNYLRVSVTDRCNLQCIYCIPQGTIQNLPHAEVLRYEEILRIVRIGVHLGISKVRVTGGEPLIRKGIYGFLNKLNTIKGLKDVSLTTNGILLKDNLEKIRAAGIKRLNISLDTLDPDKFKRITRHDHFSDVWNGIMKAHEMGFAPIKLNAVILRGVNDDEILDLARLSLDYPFHIRFIEYMPIGDAGVIDGQTILTPEIKNRLHRIGELAVVQNKVTDGPAQRFKFQNAPGEVGFISAISHHFCHTCNRLRLTASGRLRPCLLANTQFDLKKPLRQGYLDRDLAEVFFKTARFKQRGHHLVQSHPSKVIGQMSAIGG